MDLVRLISAKEGKISFWCTRANLSPSSLKSRICSRQWPASSAANPPDWPSTLCVNLTWFIGSHSCSCQMWAASWFLGLRLKNKFAYWRTSRLRTVCSRCHLQWSVLVLGLHHCMLILLLRRPSGWRSPAGSACSRGSELGCRRWTFKTKGWALGYWTWLSRLIADGPFCASSKLLFLLVWSTGRWAWAACLGPAFVSLVFRPCSCCVEVWVGFSRHTFCLLVSGVGLA